MKKKYKNQHHDKKSTTNYDFDRKDPQRNMQQKSLGETKTYKEFNISRGLE